MEVYKIESQKIGELLFAAAWEDVDADWKAQLELLKKGTHPITKLQNHFNKFGASDFILTTGDNLKPENVGKALAKFYAVVPVPKVEVSQMPEIFVEKIEIISDEKGVRFAEPKKTRKPRTKKK